jgi:CBS domain containing-hemolysin-like protein
VIPLLVILALVLLNGLFVAAEFAIVGVPRPAIRRRATAGERIAGLVQRILSDPRWQDQYIATAQLGITAASLGLGMYGEHVVAEGVAAQLEGWGAARWIAAHAAGSVLAVTVLTYLHIVVGEMVPKSLALQYAEPTVLAVTPPVLWIRTLLYPFVVGFNALGNGLLRLVGFTRRPSAAEYYYTPEELQLIVEESQATGLLRPEAGRVLRELFEFGELTVGEAMVPRVEVTGIPEDATPEEIEEILVTTPHTRYPVYREDLDHIVGAVHVKDLLARLVEGRPLAVDRPRPVAYLPKTTPLDRVLEVMHQSRSQLVVVLDEQGGTRGIVTIEDLFEEIVGEIEPDPGERPEIWRDAAGRLHVAGTVRLDEVGEHLGVELEHEEVDTTSGLILALLERPARVGDVVVYEGVRFEVAAVAGHGVREAIVTHGQSR